MVTPLEPQSGDCAYISPFAWALTGPESGPGKGTTRHSWRVVFFLPSLSYAKTSKCISPENDTCPIHNISFKPKPYRESVGSEIGCGPDKDEMPHYWAADEGRAALLM